ncbi:MAG TPA: benzoyl-CoA 2,3-epoxidase subunit BoxB [Planctomycetota bacterium]|nr:benzoyl-CoA 2,3-epoxidase subunit BoxB [Planctomycetota bacterium]
MSLYDSIPNNVDLASDEKLKRALERWQPEFKKWWLEMGPEGFQGDDVYLRTAISVDSSGWAHFDYVKMPDYRWGIFLAGDPEDRKVGFGDVADQRMFEEVPGEFRNMLRRLIVTQGDTEPASVEQQRRLGKTAPSLYDLRNLFQVNVEEGRHLWAMVYLLHKYFGRDGREEAEEMLARRAGDPDKPRILQAFNNPCEDWLSFFMFTMFIDRDGKFQLASLAESGFGPMRRTCRFMLTEEAHHLFVGETGVGRVVRKTAQLMKQAPNEEVETRGGIPLRLINKWINYWVTYGMDLFGGEISSNAADAFAAGLKGRYREEDKYTDHVALGETVTFEVFEDGKLTSKTVPYRNALNEVLREEYIRDCERAVNSWNKILADEGVTERLAMPSRRFHRHVGAYAGGTFGVDGRLILDAAEYEAEKKKHLPTPEDHAYVQSLMKPCVKPGEYAGWLAPPNKGINGRGLDFQYVRFAHVGS